MPVRKRSKVQALLRPIWRLIGLLAFEGVRPPEGQRKGRYGTILEFATSVGIGGEHVGVDISELGSGSSSVDSAKTVPRNRLFLPL